MKNSSPTDLTPLASEEWDASLSNVIEDMNGAPINVHKLMANNPALLQAWWNFRTYTVNGCSLGSRKTELVILRVGIQLSAWYEWGAHVDRATKCGLTLDEINAVSKREIGPQWSHDEANLLAAVDELVENRFLSKALRIRLDEDFTPPQQLDIIAIHGMYSTLGSMINTWGLELDPAVNARIQSHTTRETFNATSKVFHAKS